jgi:thioredoxin-related protein
LAKAKAEKKFLFVDAYTTWCGPCKWMSANTFPDSKVGEYFNANFVSYKLDMEKGEGPDIAKKYSVNAYPTLLFIESSGQLIDVAVGARDVKGFLELGQKVMNGGYETIVSKKAKFDQGVRDRDFLFDYLMMMQEANQEPGEVLNAFKEGMKGDAMLDEKNWKVFVGFFNLTTSEQFQYVESHIDQFKAKFGDDIVTQKIAGSYLNLAYGGMMDGDMDTYKSATAKAKSFKNPTIDAMLQELDLTRIANEGDWKAYCKVVDGHVKAGLKDANPLNNYAWAVFEGCSDKKLLEKALKWATLSVEAEPGYYNLDTKAMLLNAVGRTKEAIATAEAAIAAAKVSGDDYAETEKAMNSWK